MDTGAPSGKQWRFESIDLRAGMAIALWREERSAAHGFPPEHAPALFFSPPYFQPEPIVNTAVALSACRGTFQPGLYVDENGTVEASFSLPEDVGEFLRRAYIGGAGGDGGDGGEQEPQPPTPEGDDGGLELPSFGEHRIVRDLVTRVKLFGVTAEETPGGKSFSFVWGEDMHLFGDRHNGSGVAEFGDEMALATAALSLLATLLNRAPHLSDEGAWLRWYGDVRELIGMAHEIGVAGIIQTEPSFRDIPVKLMRQRFPNEFPHMSEERWRDLCWLILFGPTVRDLNSFHDLFLAEDLVYGWLPWDRDYIFPPSIRVDDPLDILSRLPLPKTLQTMFPLDMQRKSTAYHLLNLMVSEPQALAHDSATMSLAVCIGLFAAACVVSVPSAVSHIEISLRRYRPDNFQRARRATEQARAWLTEHMPRTGYARSYEDIIAKVKSLRYFVKI